MAFTDAEKVRIREYLGWTSRFGRYDTALERGISAIEMLPAEMDRAREHLAELARIDAARTACEARFKASKVGTIELNRAELHQLGERGAERVARLARMFGAEVRSNPFSPTLPTTRDSFDGPLGGGNGQMQG